MQGQARAFGRIRRRDFGRRRRGAPAQPVALADTEAFIFADRLHFPRADDLLGASTLHRHVRTGNSAHNVVAAVDLVDVRAFAHALLGADQNAIAAVDQCGAVGVQFDNADRARAVYRVDLAVIEKDREIVQPLLNPIVLPRAARIGRAKHLQSEPIHVGKNVISAFVIAEAGRPDALAVNLFAAFQPEVGPEIQAVEGISDPPPVHQIARVQDRQTGHGVHGGAGQVIVGADADHVGIRELIVEQRVRVGSVSVVGCPGAARVRCMRHRNGGENQREATHFI